MGEPQFVERADPEEAFSALSDGTRIAILQALWEHDATAVSFSELREAVGVRDSGQFNYHLDQLVGPFVTRTDDGYELTQAGTRINGAIEAGAYTMEGTFEPMALAVPCTTCGGERTLHYEDETVRVECESCPIRSEFAVPPSAIADCDREAIPEVTSRYLETTLQHIEKGFCAFCDGPVEPTVGPITELVDPPADPTEDFPADVAPQVDDLPFVQYDCRRCGATSSSGLSLALLSHPAVTGFFHDHGVNLKERPIWEYTTLDADRERVRSREPLRASVTFRVDGAALTVVVDETADVVDIER